MGTENEIKEATNLTVILWGNHISEELLSHINCKTDINIEGEIDDFKIKKFISKHFPKYTYYIIKIENFKLLNSIIKKNKNIVIIYFFPELDQKNKDKIFIKRISEIKSNNIHDSPFIVFISKIPRKEYIDYIYFENIDLDPLNILSFNKYYKEDIFRILEDLENYYHQRPNKVLYNDLGINLCVLGSPGKGKSSFINCVAEKKLALEGRNTDTTKEFTKYTIYKRINGDIGVINIYDCPGFGISGNELTLIKNSISEKFEIFKRKHDYIHGFLYFLYKDETERTLDDGEKEIIEHIYDKLYSNNHNSIVLFIINRHIDDENSINSYKNRLFSELNREPKFKGKFENKDNIIYVNLKKNIYGIDKVFRRLYDFFQNQKVEIIRKNVNETEIEFSDKIKKLVKQSMFFKYIEKEEDIINRQKEACDSIINDCINQTKIFGKERQIEEIKELRLSMLKKLKKQLESSLYILESQELNKKEIYDKTFFNIYIKKIPLLGPWLEGKHMEEESPKVTKEIGRLFIERHIETMKYTSSVDFCLSAAMKYNISIDLLDKISTLFPSGIPSGNINFPNLNIKEPNLKSGKNLNIPNINEEIEGNISGIDAKIKGPKSNQPENIQEIENNEIEEKEEKKEIQEKKSKCQIKELIKNGDFILKFTTNIKNPRIKVHKVTLFDQEYIFRFEIIDPSLENENSSKLSYTKKITDIDLAEVKPYNVDKKIENGKCNVSIFYKTNNLDSDVY